MGGSVNVPAHAHPKIITWHMHTKTSKLGHPSLAHRAVGWFWGAHQNITSWEPVSACLAGLRLYKSFKKRFGDPNPENREDRFCLQTPWPLSGPNPSKRCLAAQIRTMGKAVSVSKLLDPFLCLPFFLLSRPVRPNKGRLSFSSPASSGHTQGHQLLILSPAPDKQRVACFSSSQLRPHKGPPSSFVLQGCSVRYLSSGLQCQSFHCSQRTNGSSPQP